MKRTEWPARWHKDHDAMYPVLLCGRMVNGKHCCQGLISMLLPARVGLGTPQVLATIGMVERPAGVWDRTARSQRYAAEGGHHGGKLRRKVELDDDKRGYMHQQMNNAIAQRGKAIVVCPDCRALNRVDSDVLAPGTSAVLGLR